MRPSEKQISSVISLPAESRYEHFIKQVADTSEIWGLYNDGWAISADDEGLRSLPLWCAHEYAQLSQSDEWNEYKPKWIELDFFLDEMLADLEANSISVAVMYLPTDAGVVVHPNKLAPDLEAELDNY